MATATLSKHEMDFTHGSIMKKLIIFATPLVLTNLFQKVFTITDTIILGILVNDKAVGSVGATATLITLFLNFFIGLSSGSTVVLSRALGQGNIQKARKIVGSSIFMSVFGGIILALVGFFGAETFLTWMKCDELLLPGAVRYIKIYFLGIPIILFYNFVAGLLRAVGDTFRPMIYLTIAGVVNVGLNIFFIMVFNMTVEGVAIGTVGSHLIASVLAFIAVKKSDGYARFDFKFFKLFKEEVKEIMNIGLPSGIQGSLFAISNVLIQTTVNTFGDQATTGAAIASQYDAFIYMVGNSIALAGMSFTSQNYGACNYKRIKESIIKTVILASATQFLVGTLFCMMSEPLGRIMSQDPVVLGYTKTIMFYIGLFYFLCGIMETFSYTLRALGKSVTSMIISVFFAVIFRIVWIAVFFVLMSSPFAMIYISYPISWILCVGVQIIIILSTMKKLSVKLNKTKNENNLTNEKIA